MAEQVEQLLFVITSLIQKMPSLYQHLMRFISLWAQQLLCPLDVKYVSPITIFFFPLYGLRGPL